MLAKFIDVKMSIKDMVLPLFKEGKIPDDKWQFQFGKLLKYLKYLLATLLESCLHIVQTVDLVPADKQTRSYVRDKLMLRAAKKVEKKAEIEPEPKPKADSSVFKAALNQSEAGCFNCGKVGHNERDCWSKSRGQGNFRGRFNFNQRGRANFNNNRNFRSRGGNNKNWRNNSYDEKSPSGSSQIDAFCVGVAASNISQKSKSGKSQSVDR